MAINELITFAAVEATPDKGEVLGKALLNTAMGLGIVFCVLLLISFIISLFKYINKFQNRNKNKQVNNIVEAPIEKSVADESENLTDDCELVAVITAAIYAYEAQNQSNENIAPGELFIRSIRKVSKRKAFY